MKKWVAVRVCGWLSLFCALLVSGGFTYWLSNGRPGVAAVGIILFAVVSFILACVWFMGSLLAWATRRHAELLARQAAMSAGAPGASPFAGFPPRGVTPATNGEPRATPANDAWRCGRCGAVNVPAEPRAGAGAPGEARPRAVMTSPLSGAR